MQMAKPDRWCMPDLRLGFVDVPAMSGFVKNMLAGVGGIDLVMLVVAADNPSSRRPRAFRRSAACSRFPRGADRADKSDLVDEELLSVAHGSGGAGGGIVPSRRSW